MSCSNCGNGSPRGCKNNGTCGTSGCNKLTVFDWLSNMNDLNGENSSPYVEVRFKNDRKAYFDRGNHSLSVGDAVAVEAASGHDIGIVTLTGELVRIQMRNKKINTQSDQIRKVYRKATEKDITTWHRARENEGDILMEARKMVDFLKLEMKLSDVEFQGDGSKATFYYTADTRVDFRQLIKDFATAFKVKIEMRQIGYRQQASKVGGIGSCGRELCCATWLTDFRSVSTSSARYQQLSVNPQKLAGQCGKLKCCLNFELDAYLEVLDDFPGIETTLKTSNGIARCVKIDVFKKLLWFSYEGEWLTWYQVPLDELKKLLKKQESGQEIPPLGDIFKTPKSNEQNGNIKRLEEDNLKRFDKPKSRNWNGKHRPKKQNQQKREKQ